MYRDQVPLAAALSQFELVADAAEEFGEISGEETVNASSTAALDNGQSKNLRGVQDQPPYLDISLRPHRDFRFEAALLGMAGSRLTALDVHIVTFRMLADGLVDRVLASSNVIENSNTSDILVQISSLSIRSNDLPMAALPNDGTMKCYQCGTGLKKMCRLVAHVAS